MSDLGRSGGKWLLESFGWQHVSVRFTFSRHSLAVRRGSSAFSLSSRFCSLQELIDRSLTTAKAVPGEGKQRTQSVERITKNHKTRKTEIYSKIPPEPSSEIASRQDEKKQRPNRCRNRRTGWAGPVPPVLPGTAPLVPLPGLNSAECVLSRQREERANFIFKLQILRMRDQYIGVNLKLNNL